MGEPILSSSSHGPSHPWSPMCPVYTRARASGEEEQKVIELGRAVGASPSEQDTSDRKATDGVPRKAADNAGNLLAALHAVRQMACHNDPLAQHPGSYALSQHLGISRAHGVCVCVFVSACVCQWGQQMAASWHQPRARSRGLSPPPLSAASALLPRLAAGRGQAET